mmetsp:Transcript_4512/g.13274  ORF Transcript_4512/g.13274 Transcript_4512/m.13274 type:complete len:247 (-) Transcript_4512:1554-2294(-)
MVDMRCSADEKWCRCTIRTAVTGQRAFDSCTRFSSACALASSPLSASSCLPETGAADPAAATAPAPAAGAGAASIRFLRAPIARSSGSESPGFAVCEGASYLHPMPSSAAVSIGSPTSLEPSMATREWQPASTTAQSGDASTTGRCCGGLADAPAPASRMPTGTSLSEVSVPVLSKKTASTLPAIGSRKGSVQKMPALSSAMRAVLTAIAVCIGRWRGTTDVRMMTQRSSSSCVVRSPFSSPLWKT